MKPTASSARNQPAADTGAAASVRRALSPLPSVKPQAMNRTNAETFSVASRLLTKRPGPTPRTWTNARAQMSASAMIVCGEKESCSVPGTIGMAKNGVVSPAAGKNRAM